jgi:hypothetical protein
MTQLALLLLLALLGGCAGFAPQPGPGAEPAGSYRPLTLPFIAMGDTQEHLATGYPMHDNDSATDACVEVAQRPPDQTLFGRRLLEWALLGHPDMPFLHPGDVMDLSCRVEAERRRSYAPRPRPAPAARAQREFALGLADCLPADQLRLRRSGTAPAGVRRADAAR